MTIEQYKSYCNSLTKYSRYNTREVKIGDVPLGAHNPIRVQSMTTTDTMNTIATVEQSIKMIEAGCEYVRITAPSINEAQNLQNIKDELRRRGYKTPLIADIHFTPNAAELAARIVEKVRVNPGNYVDKKKFQTIEYTDSEYLEELERIRERFTPLVKICKEYGTAMRIGTNHGSLSDRIMSRYGDTPLGMVESALEFLRICESESYYNIVLSMKASNTQVMVQAYRLLISKMQSEGMNYPLHLGVTEAGDGEDGRIKSAVGIGTLLEDGIGDTVRVSLTEPPEFEIPVAYSLINRYKKREEHKAIPQIESIVKDPYKYERRATAEVSGIGGTTVPKVFADFSTLQQIDYEAMKKIGYTYSAETDKWNIADIAADFLFLGNNSLPFDSPNTLKIVHNFNKWIELEDRSNSLPYFSSLNCFLNSSKISFAANFVEVDIDSIMSSNFIKAAQNKTVVFVLVTENNHAMAELRRAFYELIKLGLQNPIIVKRRYNDENENLRLKAATDFGALLLDGFGDAVWIDSDCDKEFINKTLFGILQACRTRISKTEYIACPSCGRTLFDLVEVTNTIRNRTEHLKGVKIAIMGCIVNGPGEMADADYGYVGSGVGKITLYRGKEVVKKNINSEKALDELISLISEDGNWVPEMKNEL